MVISRSLAIVDKSPNIVTLSKGNLTKILVISPHMVIELFGSSHLFFKLWRKLLKCPLRYFTMWFIFLFGCYALSLLVFTSLNLFFVISLFHIRFDSLPASFDSPDFYSSIYFLPTFFLTAWSIFNRLTMSFWKITGEKKWLWLLKDIRTMSF